MKGLLLCFLLSCLFIEKGLSQNSLQKCLGIDTNIKTVRTIKFKGMLIGIEMLPQGVPFIKELERKKLAPRYHHYYSLQIKPDACETNDWFICGDNNFKIPEDFETPIKVNLLCTIYGNVFANHDLPIVITRIVRQNESK